MRTSFGRAEWRQIAAMLTVVAVLHLVGWGVLLGLVAPGNYHVGSQVFGVGLGVTAYVLGMRHAFDADHIAAIDNTTRKLIQDEQKPVSVGFWFSLGHSTVVFAMCLLLAFGVKAIFGEVSADSSTLHQVTGVIGPTVSGVFLVLLGILNLVTLVGITKVFRGMRRGAFDEGELERQLDNRGALNKILGGLTKAVRRPWHIYPVGVLFGLGFDTASEITLLILAGGAAAVSAPWYAVLTLPILFAAGMSLLDTLDGAFMNAAYGWAFARPVRKVYYNLTITALSVAVAMSIGVVELSSVLADSLDLRRGPVAAVGSISLDHVGYAIAALFVVAWAVSAGIWRFGRVEERWVVAAHPASSVVASRMPVESGAGRDA